MKVNVLALDGVFDTGLATVLDSFGTANELAELFGLTSLRFEVSTVAVRASVRTSQGLQVPVIPVARRAKPDLVVVPALGYKMPDPLIAALARPDVTRSWARIAAMGGAGRDDCGGVHRHVRDRSRRGCSTITRPPRPGG